ncbi:hypothetical protein RRG08_045501 [Elysia crispata]|uniref:Uncharacterized protein n=1 Tax=Elysia crispata TaxID=231223 RepID=A0AAE1AEM8_9GAST|nr:hypothetical protein RRG08_045501 [Elysia crispata]
MISTLGQTGDRTGSHSDLTELTARADARDSRYLCESLRLEALCRCNPRAIVHISSHSSYLCESLGLETLCRCNPRAIAHISVASLRIRLSRPPSVLKTALYVHILHRPTFRFPGPSSRRYPHVPLLSPRNICLALMGSSYRAVRVLQYFTSLMPSGDNNIKADRSRPSLELGSGTASELLGQWPLFHRSGVMNKTDVANRINAAALFQWSPSLEESSPVT